MTILAISDIHSDINLLSHMENDLRNSDLILLSGDITHFGKTSIIKKIIGNFRQYNSNILAIPGNCDYHEVNQYLAEEDIALDCRFRIINNHFIMGIGGSLPCPGGTPNEYSEEEFNTMLEEVVKKNINCDPIILLVHQPPFNTLCDRLNDGFHVGSHSVRLFIEKYQPAICYCGHIHEGVGIDAIGKTVIVNPGPLRMGKYSRTNFNSSTVNAEIINMFAG